MHAVPEHKANREVVLETVKEMQPLAEAVDARVPPSPRPAAPQHETDREEVSEAV